MSCLTEEMKNKRDRKRKWSLLVVDGDLGNMGLYKSILATEFDMVHIFTLEDAKIKLEAGKYDAIILDDDFDNEKLLEFIQDINRKNREQIICFITEQANRPLAIRGLCKGANRVIEKPFTRDGLTNGIYEELKIMRDNYIRKHILIVDESLSSLDEMNKKLKDSFDVTIMNCAESGLKYIREYKPDLVIIDANILEMLTEDVCRDLAKEKESRGISLLFMTENPDEECVLRCAQFKPDGFLVKPIDMEQLLDNIERTFLVDAYGVRK